MTQIDATVIAPAEASAIAQAAFDNATMQMPLAKVLPMKSNMGSTFVKWVPNKAANQHMMGFRAWGAEPDYANRDGAAIANATELLPLSARLRISEQDVVASRMDPMFLRTRAEENLRMLGEQAAWTLEYARFESVFQGSISLGDFTKDSGANTNTDGSLNNASYDFGRDSDLTVSSGVKFSASTADPIDQILKWKKLIRGKGGMEARAAIINTVTLDLLESNPKFVSAALRVPASNAPSRIGEQDAMAALRDYCGLDQVVVLDEAYRAMNVSTQTGAPEAFGGNSGIFMLVPDLNGSAGFTASGPTVEAADPSYGIGKTDNSGLIGAIFQTEEPVGWETYVNGSALPVLVQSNSTLASQVL